MDKEKKQKLSLLLSQEEEAKTKLYRLRRIGDVLNSKTLTLYDKLICLGHDIEDTELKNDLDAEEFWISADDFLKNAWNKLCKKKQNKIKSIQRNIRKVR